MCCVQASARAALPLVNPHMLRHSCGFALANRGYDLRLIQDYLGHHDPKHTVRYTRTAGHRFEGLWRSHEPSRGVPDGHFAQLRGHGAQ
jgi:site-specific recombinase XerD